jgi:hypothetical protein
MSIAGSVLDPARQLGAFEQKAIEALGEPLQHVVINPGDRERRDTQMRTLYEQFGWSLADVGEAYDMSKEWVRQNVLRVGGTMRTISASRSKRRPR